MTHIFNINDLAFVPCKKKLKESLVRRRPSANKVNTANRVKVKRLEVCNETYGDALEHILTESSNANDAVFSKTAPAANRIQTKIQHSFLSLEIKEQDQVTAPVLMVHVIEAFKCRFHAKGNITVKNLLHVMDTGRSCTNKRIPGITDYLNGRIKNCVPQVPIWLTDHVVKSTHLSEVVAQQLVSSAFNVILKELKARRGVNFGGAFAMRIRTYGPKTKRNPDTGIQVEIPAYDVVVSSFSTYITGKGTLK